MMTVCLSLVCICFSCAKTWRGHKEPTNMQDSVYCYNFHWHHLDKMYALQQDALQFQIW